MVLLEEPVEQLDARGGADGPPGHLPVGVEAVVEGDVSPAVGGDNDLVELAVDGPHPGHIGVDGIGRFAIESLRNDDLPIIMGTVLIGCVLVVIMNLIVDIAYSFLDPRVRLS